MLMIYNSDAYAVVQVGLTPDDADSPEPRSGFEIVDKSARKGIYIEGALAETFRRGVQALVDAGPDADRLDEFIGGFTALAQQPLLMH